MANLLQSSASTATTAPDFYNNYLSNLANSGTQAAQNAQFVGAQPLQEQAFGQVADAASAYKPTLESAGSTLNQATGSTAPLAAATPYLTNAISDPSQAAQSYMTPYIRSVIDALGDTGQRNIMQNLSPLATAAAVGSGQFGSKRGAEVLGQTISNADRDILNAQSAALNTGYQNALNAAIQQNQIEGTAGATAGNAASQGQANLIQAGNAQSNLAGQNQALGLADINALSTLGGQQQTIAQNKENFPLTKLSTLSGLMAGQTIPTTQTQTAQVSPLSAMATLGAGSAGLFNGTGANGTGPSLFQNMTGYKDLTGLAQAAGSGLSSLVNKATAPATGSQAGNATTDYATAGGGLADNTLTYDPSSPTGYRNNAGQVVDGNGTVIGQDAGSIGGTTYNPSQTYDDYGNPI